MTGSTPWHRWLLAIVVSGFATFAYSNEKPAVVTSIRPLALLIAEVTGTDVELHTLIGAGQSPHTFQMRPSDRRQLADADLVFWIGPALETFLQDLMSQADLSPKSTALGPKILPELFGNGHSEHAQSDAHDQHEHQAEESPYQEPGTPDHHHDHAGADPHIWLEPELGLEMAKVIAAELKKTGLVDGERIDANLADFGERLAATDKRIRSWLASRGNATYFTYHDAFRPFTEHYGLEIAGSLTFSPEVQPGARHLSEVREKLRGATNPCVLTEPQFSRQWWKSITGGVDLTVSRWDPLANDIAPETGSYTRFLEGMAEAILNCGV